MLYTRITANELEVGDKIKSNSNLSVVNLSKRADLQMVYVVFENGSRANYRYTTNLAKLDFTL